MHTKPEAPLRTGQIAQCAITAKPEAEELVTAAQVVMTRRRNLLKAAASVAPVLATLPNSAALANASAFQCANELLKEANEEQIIGDLNGPPSTNTPFVGDDHYYRVAGKRWTRAATLLTPFRWDGSQHTQGGTTLYHFIAFNGASVTVDINGNRFTDTPPQGATDVQLLVLYQPVSDAKGLVTDLKANIGGRPGNCTINNSNFTSSDYCIYPIAQVGRQSAGSYNIGMTESCLTSFATPT